MAKQKRIGLPYNFQARPYQTQLFNVIATGKKKRAVAVWHRRAGKDKTLINLMCVMAHLRKGIYYYFYPTLKQAKKAIWDGMDKNGFPHMGHIPKEIRLATNQSELKIVLHCGSIIQLIGSDYIDSIMSTNPIGCVFSEYSLQNPNGWEFVRPILRENGGWAVFNSTPRGKNHLYRLIYGDEKWPGIQDNPEWYHEVLTVDDTYGANGGTMGPQDVEAERAAGMDEDLIRQEFYCSFEASVVGAYYGTQMRLAEEQDRITRVSVDTGVPVNTYWDLGIDDSTSIWFGQTIGSQRRWVHYYENAGEGLNHYAGYITDWLSNHDAVMGDNVLPHDGGRRMQGKEAQSAQDILYDLRFPSTVADRPKRKEDGIEAVRRMLAQSWFDRTECRIGIEALRNYRKKWDDVNGVFMVRPVHNKFSHGADAFQTAALSHEHDMGYAGSFRPRR